MYIFIILIFSTLYLKFRNNYENTNSTASVSENVSLFKNNKEAERILIELTGPGEQTPCYIYSGTHPLFPDSLYLLGIGFCHEKFGLEEAKRRAIKDLRLKLLRIISEYKTESKKSEILNKLMNKKILADWGRDPRTHIFYALYILDRKYLKIVE